MFYDALVSQNYVGQLIQIWGHVGVYSYGYAFTYRQELGWKVFQNVKRKFQYKILETRPEFLGKKYSDVRTHTQRYLRTSLLTCIHTYPNYVFFPPIVWKEHVWNERWIYF